MQCLWHPVLHFQSAEDILRKIPAWLPLQIQNTSPPVLEEDSRLCQTKANDSVGGWLMRPLHITKSVECLISSHQSTFSCLFSNMEFYFLTVLLQIGSYFCTAISTQESLHIIYTTLLLNKPSSPFPVANTHPQLLLKLHPDFGVCHIHLPSVPCDTLYSSHRALI